MTARRFGLLPRLWRAILVLSLVLGGLQAIPARATNPDPVSAMAAMVAAMQAGDAEALQGLFPQDGSWAYVGTAGGENGREEVPAAALRRDFALRSGWYELLLGGGPDDSFKDVFEATGFGAWQAVDAVTFRPPEDVYPPGHAYVRWRLEGGRWVVDAIGEPGS